MRFTALLLSLGIWLLSPQGKPENGWVSPLGLRGMGQGKAQVRVCTEEEAAEFYIQHQWMMPGEAEEKAACLYEDGFRQMEYTAEHDFGDGNTVVAGTRVLCGVSQGIPFFEEVLLEWTEGENEKGSFDEDYVLTTISSDKQSLQIQARGTYEVVVDNCLTGSVGLDLEVLGFECSHTAGGKTYYHKNAAWGKTWTKS